MALLVKDRIKETTTTTGTGTITLAGAATGYQAFSVIGNASTTYYAIEDANGTGWEVGLGTYTLSGTTLARTTILASSNSGAAITLTSGTHDVFVTYPAGKAGFNDQGIAKTFTASGTVTAGKPVILEADGDAAQIAETGSTVTESIGAVQYYDAGSESYYNYRTNSCMLSGAYFLNVYNEGTNQYPSARIGQVGTDKTITWGTEVVLKSSAQAYQYKAPVYDVDADRIGIFVSSNPAGGTDPYKFSCATASASGTTLTVNTFTDIGSIDSASPTPVYAAYDPDNTTIVAICEGDTTFNTVTAFQVDVTGSTPSVDHQTSFAANFRSDEQQDKFVYDTYVDRFIYIYEDEDDNDQLKSRVLQNSGSAFTWGSANDISADNPEGYYGLAFDSTNNKLVTIYASNDTLTYSYSVGTVTGGGTNTTSWTSPVDINTAKNRYNPIALFYHPNAKKFLTVLSELGATSDNQKLYTATLSGSTLTMGETSYLLEDFAVNSSINDIRIAGVFDSVVNDPVTINFGGASNANPYYRLDSYVFNTGQTPTTNVTATNYLGVAATTASDTNPVEVNIPGSINNDQSGLTIGSQYFTTNAGVVGTTGPTFLGTAVSATALQLEQKSGSTLLGTSDGAITAGKPVIVEADGDFAQVTGSRTTYSGSAITDGGVAYANASSTDPKANKMMRAASNGSGTFAIVWNEENGLQPYIVLGTANTSGVITWGTPVEIEDVPDGGAGKSYLYYDPDADIFVAGNLWYDSAYYMKHYPISYSGTVPTIGTGVSSLPRSAKTAGYIVGVYNTTDNIGYVVAGSPSGRIGTVTSSGTGGSATLTVGNWVFCGGTGAQTNSNIKYTSHIYDNTNNRGTFLFQDLDNSNYPTVRAYTETGGTFTLGTPLVLESTACGEVNGLAEGEADSHGTFAMWQSTTAWYPSSTVKYSSLTYSGLTITASGPTTYDTGFTENYQDTSANGQNLWYNPNSENYFWGFVNYDGGNNYPAYAVLTESSGVLTQASTQMLSSTSAFRSYSTSGCAVNTGLDNAFNLVVSNNYNSAQVAGNICAQAYSETVLVTNLTTENYIGIAEATVADATAVKVTTVGGADNQQSSLTPAQLYYVQIDGTLSTTADVSYSVIAGTALSATKLLVSRS